MVDDVDGGGDGGGDADGGVCFHVCLCAQVCALMRMPLDVFSYVYSLGLQP